MNELEITAAEAAQRAAGFAERAQASQHAVDIFRLENLGATEDRGFPPSRIAELEKTVDDMTRARDEMVSLANMWANVAGALHLAAAGEPS